MTEQSNINWSALVPNGTEAYFYPGLNSTNIRASEMARSGSITPLWVVAGQQSSGKGRLGREWVSDTGNFYGSYLFRPTMKPFDMAGLPFVAALAVHDAVIKCGVSESRVKCKWPNDIIVDDKKLSGILIESSIKSNDHMDHVIIGIGVNLKHCPSETLFGATSLKAIDIHSTPDTFLNLLSHSLDGLLKLWEKSGFDPIRRLWSDHAWGMGRELTINTATDRFQATLVGLEKDGGLRVRLDGGIEKSIYAGDVFPSEKI